MRVFIEEIAEIEKWEELLVLICWHHGLVCKIAIRYEADPWGDKRFEDNVWKPFKRRKGDSQHNKRIQNQRRLSFGVEAEIFERRGEEQRDVDFLCDSWRQPKDARSIEGVQNK